MKHLKQQSWQDADDSETVLFPDDSGGLNIGPK